MTVKEFLQRGRNLHFEIIRLKLILEKKLEDATAKGVDYQKEHFGHSGENMQEDKYVEYSDFCILLDNRIKELEDYQEKMLQVINSYPDSYGRSLLLMRYVECLSWEKIAEEMSYEVRHVQRLHGKILIELEKKSSNVMKCH